MKFGAYLEQYQPVAYRAFARALENHRVAHAYLLSGEAGVPLLKTATYFAKSLLCDHPNPLACEECRSCLRVDHHTYSDFIVLDGKNGQIKKGDVQTIVSDFSKTPLEAKGTLIYVVNLVENMNVQAINSLLKFLEEPPAGTYAFLTCENEAKVLPTIISRCERIRLLLLSEDVVFSEALKEGVSEEDAEWLAPLINDPTQLAEAASSEEYHTLRQLIDATLDALLKGPNDAAFVMESSVIPALTGGKKNAVLLQPRYYLDMLSLVFQDAITHQVGGKIRLTSKEETIGQLVYALPHLDASLAEILKVRSLLDTNLSSALALMHLILFLTEENV